MKVLLTTLNSKFIHTNLAIRYIKESIKDLVDVDIREYTINNQLDYILKDIKNCTSVYLYADREFRKNRVKEIYGSNAEIMDKEEKNRADYYNYYTGNRWGDINNYDFAINTSKVSFEEAADLIYRFAKDKQKNLKDR